MNKLVVIDGNSLMYRAFHALPEMSSSDGTPTNAVYGFLSMLLKVVESEEPDGLLVAFDEHGPTFRHGMFDQYKAGRKPTPDELRIQMTLIRRVLSDMGIAQVGKPGLEADDMLGIFSRRAEKSGAKAVLFTGDRDALQLTSKETTVVLTKKGISETVKYTPQVLMEQYGVEPEAMIQVKALMGDASDNIPGVAGVGEKTALKLVQEFGTLENILNNIDKVKGEKLKERLREHSETARMSLDLARIITDPGTDTGLSLEQCSFDKSTMAGAAGILSQLELRNIAARIPKGAEPVLHKTEFPTKLIKDVNELESILPELMASGEVAFSLGKKLSVSADTGTQFEIEVTEQLTLLDEANSLIDILAAFRPVFEAEKPQKLLYDAKEWMQVLSGEGIDLNGECFDAMIAAYLLKPSRTVSGFEELCDNSGLDHCAAALFVMRDNMTASIEKAGLSMVYNEIEMPLVRVLFDMEKIGFRVDTDVLFELGQQFDKDIELLSREIYDLAGEKFNILSPKQLGAILFEKLELPYSRKTKSGYSTDADTLEFLSDKHPIADKVLEYRKLTKLKSTYIDGLTAAKGKDGRVHSRFNQTVTATGRISSSEPNLQNIPTRTALGREIRRAFIASEGNLLVGGDYSQIELRVLAHMADDLHMIEAFNSGEDIHRTTAARVFGVPVDQVTGDMRSAAKAVNFGIVYGISDFGLAKNINTSRKKAAEYINAYLTQYSGVKSFMSNVVEDARQKGYVTTIFGRRRDIPELKSSNYNTRSFGERAAMNAPIQGTAADIIKLAMVKLHKELKERGFKARLILQVHDELIVDCPEQEANDVMTLLHEVMESVCVMKVALEADVKKGRSWYETK